MPRRCLPVPEVPGKRTYEVLTDGPIAIWHFIANGGNRQKKRFAFQIYRETVPMCFVTMNHQSCVVAQSEVPVFVPENMRVVVEGSGVKLYLGANCEIRDGHNKKITVRTSSSVTVPSDNIIVIFCADMSDFGDILEMIATNGMEVYCAGRNYITVKSDDTIIVSL
ncbi:hypothetical protein Tcan_10768 [Toxocara canis]|uniref:Uncharacterized protein n=1 Tax=Toxocara canis TaxID=6265 RepID=A0A0B2UW80_TOXCA|nr:hypothetical protein Tcan_10768 [Toxocara canis]